MTLVLVCGCLMRGNWLMVSNILTVVNVYMYYCFLFNVPAMDYELVTETSLSHLPEIKALICC